MGVISKQTADNRLIGILLSENISRPTAQNKGAAAKPRDGCEAYYHYREEWGNVKPLGWISGQRLQILPKHVDMADPGIENCRVLGWTTSYFAGLVHLGRPKKSRQYRLKLSSRAMQMRVLRMKS